MKDYHTFLILALLFLLAANAAGTNGTGLLLYILPVAFSLMSIGHSVADMVATYKAINKKQ